LERVEKVSGFQGVSVGRSLGWKRFHEEVLRSEKSWIKDLFLPSSFQLLQRFCVQGRARLRIFSSFQL